MLTSKKYVRHTSQQTGKLGHRVIHTHSTVILFLSLQCANLLNREGPKNESNKQTNLHIPQRIHPKTYLHLHLNDTFIQNGFHLSAITYFRASLPESKLGLCAQLKGTTVAVSRLMGWQVSFLLCYPNTHLSTGVNPTKKRRTREEKTCVKPFKAALTLEVCANVSSSSLAAVHQEGQVHLSRGHDCVTLAGSQALFTHIEIFL